MASSLTCPCLEPKRWPPEPPSWSPLDTQDFLENMGSALSFSIVDHIFTRQTTGSADHLDQSTSRHQHTDDIYDDLSWQRYWLHPSSHSLTQRRTSVMPTCVWFCSDERRSPPSLKDSKMLVPITFRSLHQTTAGHNPGDDTSLVERTPPRTSSCSGWGRWFLPSSHPTKGSAFPGRCWKNCCTSNTSGKSRCSPNSWLSLFQSSPAF